MPVAKQPFVSSATPDVGEERLEHMKKMRELKTLLPDVEMQYYRNLVGESLSLSIKTVSSTENLVFLGL